MDALSDDDFDRVSDFDMSESESELDRDSAHVATTPSTTPPHKRTPSDASGRKIIQCPYDDCIKTFNRNARLQEHLRSHTNTRPFKCPHSPCTKDFLRDTHLKHHIKSAHSDVRDYKCNWEDCDKSFATGTRLRRHLQAHEGREKYRCRGYEGCNETFRKHDTLKRHILSAHEHINPFTCDIVDPRTGKVCDLPFNTAEKLRGHQRMKHDTTRFSCTICLTNDDFTEDCVALDVPDAFFATYSELQTHITEFHPPTCEYCPTSFTTSKELKRHLEIQHGVIDPDKPTMEILSCPFPGCAHTFTKRGNLNVHVKTVHEKKKDFVCGQTEIQVPVELRDMPEVQLYGCGRSFTSKSSLEEHVRTAHLGLMSKRTEREKKRKADKEASADADYEGPKKRATRKDKGIKKTSALASLTGFPAAQHISVLECQQSVENLAIKREGQDNMFKDFEDPDDDDDNLLSGSMTMFGGTLYHQGQEYNLASGQYPTSNFSSQGLGRSQTDPCMNMPDKNNVDTEPFFDNFEYEPEPLNTMPLDPALLRL